MTRIAPAPARNPIVRGTYREVRRRFGRNLENVEIMEPQIAQLAASGCAGGLYFGGGVVARHRADAAAGNQPHAGLGALFAPSHCPLLEAHPLPAQATQGVMSLKTTGTRACE